MSAVPQDLARLRDAGGAQISPDPRAEALKRARALLAPAMRDREAPAYPIEALGPLADTCEAISTQGQVQPAMVGQCLLGAASLLTQGLWNVETLNGPRPLSLNLATLGDSGDGKSTAQAPALRTVHEWQRREATKYRDALADFAQTRKGNKGDGSTPTPRAPYRLMRDATVEGLRRDLMDGPCSQGVFSDEAAAILCGYGMSPDNRAKTAGVFSGLWDSGHLSVSRAGAPRVERYGCRVALHWLIQPMAAAEALTDPQLTQLGFWPRFLVCWPAPQPPRLARPFRPEALPAVGHYWERCEVLLTEELGDDADEAPVIPLDDSARELLGPALERFERESRRGMLRPVKPFGLRATEQACRVAGVLAAFAGRPAVTSEDARHALALVAYSLDTWLAIIDHGAADPAVANALRLFEWLTDPKHCPEWRARLAEIVNGGPACVRTKSKRDAALDVLVGNGLVLIEAGEVLALIPDEAAP